MRKLIVFCLLCSIVAVSLFFHFTPQEDAPATNIIRSVCMLSQGQCDIDIAPGYALSFQLTPKQLPVMEPIEVLISGLADVSHFHKAWFEGRDMNMGVHFLLPKKSEEIGLQQEFILKGMIPVCQIDGAMVWRLVIELIYQNERIHIYFDQSASHAP